MVNPEPEVGIVRGLAWTSVGGDTLQIEVNLMPGSGEIMLTGQLGDVMKGVGKDGDQLYPFLSAETMESRMISSRSMIFMYIFRKVRCRKTVRQPGSRWRRPCCRLSLRERCVQILP